MDVFAALSDPTRRELLRRIATGSATATQLARQLPISRQAVSKHLAVLDEAGLVDRTVSGREVYYSLRAEPLSDLVGWVSEVGAAWDKRLASLKKRLES